MTKEALPHNVCCTLMYLAANQISACPRKMIAWGRRPAQDLYLLRIMMTDRTITWFKKVSAPLSGCPDCEAKPTNDKGRGTKDKLGKLAGIRLDRSAGD